MPSAVRSFERVGQRELCPQGVQDSLSGIVGIGRQGEVYGYTHGGRERGIRDPHVAGGRIEKASSIAKFTRVKSLSQDAGCRAVLNRSAWVVPLSLGVYLGRRGAQAPQMNQGSISYGP